MEFKSQKEYEKYKKEVKQFGMGVPGGIPSGLEWFPEAEKNWLAKVDRERVDQLEKQNTNKGGGKNSSNSMQIKGNSGSSYSGDTMTISKKDAEFVDFGTVFSDKDLTDPGTKFSKKGTFKDYLNNIKGKHFDKDGNLIVPKFEMPDRVELSDEQKAANAALDSQFTKDGFYKGSDVKMPGIKDYKTKKSYRKAGNKLARRMGIDIDNRNNGKNILRSQGNRYNKKTGALNIPDFSLGSNTGKSMLKIGNQDTDLSGIRS